MAKRRNRSKGPPLCTDCRRPFKWLRMRGSWRKFDQRPVDGRTHVGARAHPVEGQHAWPTFRELVEDLMVRREISQADAQAEAYDMPWYVPHTCPTTTTSDETEETSP